MDPLPKGAYFQSFESKNWKEEETWNTQTPTKRRMMLGHLYWVKSRNWNETEITQNLGETSAYFQGLGDGKGRVKVFSYRIDNEDSFLSIDSQWIVFLVNEKGEIIKREITTD